MDEPPSTPVKLDSLHRQRCKRVYLRRRLRLALSPATALPILAFPHILEAVVLESDPATLSVLRATCREIKHEVDSLVDHARVRVRLADTGSDVPLPGPLEGRAVTGHFAENNPSVLDFEAIAARLFYLHCRPGWSEEQHQRNLWNSPFRPGPWVRQWRLASTSWERGRAQLVRYPHGAGTNAFFQSYQALRPDPCAVYFVTWGQFEVELGKLDAHYAAGGADIDVVFNVDLTDSTTVPDPRALDLQHVRRVTILFSRDCEECRGQRRQRFSETLTNLMCLFVLAAEEGRCTLVGYERWSQSMLPCFEETRASWTLRGDPVGRRRYLKKAPWLDEQMPMRERLVALIASIRRKVPGTEKMEQPVRVLTMDEWRRKVGDDYVRLMTQPDAVYRSRRRLPAYASLMGE